MMASRNHGNGNQGRQIQFLRNGNGGDGIKCVVKLLDGSQLSISMKKSSKGSELMSRIGKFLHLTDADCFSCTFNDCSTSSQVWIKADKKLTKQLKNNLPIFNFRVKFYPHDHSELKDQIARLLLFQQVRKDVFEERIPCSFVTHALLLSLCVQSDYGDWDHRRNPKSRDGKTVSGRENREDIDDIFNKLEIPRSFERVRSELQEKIYELYRGHKGLSRDEAINNYLDNARKLATYGMHSALAEDVEGDVVEVSVSSEGIMVHRDGLRIARFLWPRLIKIAYRKNKFILEDRSLNDKRKTIVFKFSTPKESKRFWRLCVEHHAFFRLGNRAKTLPRSIESRPSSKISSMVPDASSCVVVVCDDTKSRSTNSDKRRFLLREKAPRYNDCSPICNGPKEVRKYPQHNFKPSPCNFSDTRTSCQSYGDQCQRHKCDHNPLKSQLQGTIIKCFRSYEGNLNFNSGEKDQSSTSRRPERCARLPCGCPSSSNNNDKRFTNRSIDFNISGSVSIEEGGPSYFDNQTYNRPQQSVVRSSSLTNNNQNFCSENEGRHTETRKQPVELKHRHSLVGVENIKPVCIIEASERPRLSSIDGKKILSRYDPTSQRAEAAQQCNERCGFSCLPRQQKNQRHQKSNEFATYDNIDSYVSKNAGKIQLLPATPDVLPQVLVSEDLVRLHERDQISPTPLQLSAPLLSTTFPPSPVLNVAPSRVPSTSSPPNVTSKCRHHDMWDQFESYPMNVVSLPPSPKKPSPHSFPNPSLTTFTLGSHLPQMPLLQLPQGNSATKALEYRPLTQSSESPPLLPPYYVNANSHSMTNLRLHSPSSPTSHPPSFPCHTLPDRDASAFSRGLALLPKFIGHHFALPPPPTSSPDRDNNPVYSTVNKPKRILYGSSEHVFSSTVHNQSYKQNPTKLKVPPPVPPKRDLKNSFTTKNVVITAYLDPTKINNEQQGLYDNFQPSTNHNSDQSFKTFRGRSKSVDDESEGFYDNLMSEPLATVDDSTFKSSSSSSSSSTSSLSSVVHRRASVGSSFVTFDTPDGYRITEVRRADDNTVIETMVEKTLIIQGRNFVEQDKAIADAISSLSKINPGLSVEEIKINTVRQ